MTSNTAPTDFIEVDVAEEIDDQMDFEYTPRFPPPGSFVHPRPQVPLAEVAAGERVDHRNEHAAAGPSVVGGVRTIKSLRRPRVTPVA